MLFTTPARLLKNVVRTRAWNIEEYGLLALHRRSTLRYFHNRDMEPTTTQYEEAAEHLTNLTGLEISVSVTKELLSLFPLARIDLAEKGICGFGVRDELADAAGNFILGCRWPIYRDKVNMDTFLEVLKQQGEKMGLARVCQNPPRMSPEDRRANFALIPGGTES